MFKQEPWLYFKDYLDLNLSVINALMLRLRLASSLVNDF
jgi:hypothetical protein